MEINYTYADEDRPIRKAVFKTTTGGVLCYMTVDKSKDINNVDCVTSFDGTTALTFGFSRQDFADFTTLINRINKQING